MLFVFCRDSEEPGLPERDFAREVEAVGSLGGAFVLIDHDALASGDLRRALRGIAPREVEERAVYRGWMLTPERYAELYAGLSARGLRLINEPAAYRRCHYLPDSYPAIETHTARSVWVPAEEGFETPLLMERLAVFGSGPLILKDYVKSLKHAWEEACFIPSAADADGVARVVGNFLEWQGEDLNGGLVFREFVELVSIGAHPRSGMPLTEEYRVVVLDGQPLAVFPYWEAEAYEGLSPPPREWLAEVAAGVESRLFTLDVARRRAGGWIVIELGDGQVSGFPEHVDLRALLGGLAAASSH